MENCLITKYKTSANNENLPKIGQLDLNLPYPVGTIQIKGSSFRINNVDFSDNSTASISQGKLTINNKYDIENIIATGKCKIDFSDTLKYSEKIKVLSMPNTDCNIDISSLNNAALLNTITFSDDLNNVHGSFDSWITQSLILVGFHNCPKISGDIAILGNSNITELGIYNTNITGQMEGFFKNRIAKGYLGNISAQYIGNNTKPTFGGEVIAKSPSTNTNTIYITDNNNGTYTCGIAYGGMEASHKYHGLYTVATDTWSNFQEEGNA